MTTDTDGDSLSFGVATLLFDTRSFKYLIAHHLQDGIKSATLRVCPIIFIVVMLKIIPYFPGKAHVIWVKTFALRSITRRLVWTRSHGNGRLEAGDLSKIRGATPEILIPYFRPL